MKDGNEENKEVVSGKIGSFSGLEGIYLIYTNTKNTNTKCKLNLRIAQATATIV